MRRLVEVCNDKATKLYHELLEEIKEKEKETNTILFKSNGYIKDFIGTFKSTVSYGSCNHNNGTFTIILNESLVNNGTDFQIKEVLMHELIHTLPNCFNHKRQFKNKSWQFYRALGYDAQHGPYNGILNRKTRSERAKYKVTCLGCGKTYYFMRKCKQTEHAPYWNCATCGNSFEVECIK